MGGEGVGGEGWCVVVEVVVGGALGRFGMWEMVILDGFRAQLGGNRRGDFIEKLFFFVFFMLFLTLSLFHRF